MAVKPAFLNNGAGVGFGPAAFPGTTEMMVLSSSGVVSTQTIPTSDHGALTGLSDNDHPQYALLVGATFTGAVTVDADISARKTGSIVSVGAQELNTGRYVAISASTTNNFIQSSHAIAFLSDTSSPLDIATGAIVATNDNSDFSNVAGAGSHIHLENTHAQGQTVLAVTFGGVIKSKWRSDYTGNQTFACYDNGDFYWFRGGDYGPGTIAMTLNATGLTLEDGLVCGATFVLAGYSSTSTLRTQAELVKSWITSTDATRKAQCEEKIYDTAARTVARSFANGTNGYKAFKVLTTAPADADLAVSEVVFYTNGSGDLVIKLKDSGGTVRTGTVDLS